MEVKEEVKRPSVNSDDPNERKEARRTRIQRRLEEAARNKAIADGTYVKPEVESTSMDVAIFSCQATLNDLYQESKEQVYSILVTRDAKELERRQTEVEEREEKMRDLRKDSTEALKKLDEISKKWETLVQTRQPFELQQHMKEQKKQCLEIIEHKNELIKGFQRELRIADERYTKSRKEMNEELTLLTRKIDEQILVMKKAYRGEFEIIEETMDKTTTDLMEKQTGKWLTLYNQREADEVTNVERKFSMVQKFHEDMYQLHIEHEEKIRECRIQLESDIQVLEQELDQMKALCLLNSEKLDYNYQVLKKREEENLYIKNHQKRRLNKLQDLINTMKQKMKESKQFASADLRNLIRDVNRYHTRIIEAERNAKLFAKVNDEKFHSLWDMKEEEAKELLEKIRIADRIIYEQILGVHWRPPNISSLNKADLPSYKSALIFTNNSIKSNDSSLNLAVNRDFREKDTSPEILEAHRRLLHHILGLIADGTGFLMDQKMNELLRPYSDVKKACVRLDNVFAAIGISKEKDIELLKKAFYPYTFCMICNKKDRSTTNLKNKTDLESRKAKQISKPSPLQERSRELQDKIREKMEKAQDNISKGQDSDQDDTDEDDMDEERELSEMEDKAIEDTSSTAKQRKESDSVPQTTQQTGMCNITHPLIIEKHKVLSGLKDFVASFHSDRCRYLKGIESKLDEKRYTLSRLLTQDDIIIYWEKYLELVPAKLENIWEVVFLSLTRHLKLVQERHQINLKAQALKKQNQELKRLLYLYKIEKVEEFSLPVISSVPNKPIDFEEISKISNKLSH